MGSQWYTSEEESSTEVTTTLKREQSINNYRTSTPPTSIQVHRASSDSPIAGRRYHPPHLSHMNMLSPVQLCEKSASRVVQVASLHCYVGCMTGIPLSCPCQCPRCPDGMQMTDLCRQRRHCQHQSGHYQVVPVGSGHRPGHPVREPPVVHARMFVCIGTQRKVPGGWHCGRIGKLSGSHQVCRDRERLVCTQLCMGNVARHGLHQPQRACCTCGI